MSKIRNISGFPEWLPEQKLLENQVIERIRAIYESHGFTPIETPAVELMTTLVAQGVMDKEIYTVKRAEKDEQPGASEAELGLHFDLTVPFARYVAQHYNDITFPFKRYQLQKVWRGERPQKGRFREFYQFDIDIIARDELPIACDAEVVTILDKAFTELGIGGHQIRINNRKILFGIYQDLGLEEGKSKEAIIALDKLDKIGRDGVVRELVEKVQLQNKVAERLVDLSTVRFGGREAQEHLGRMPVNNDLFLEGKGDLLNLLKLLGPQAQSNIEIDLSLARGLAYYTGAIFEVTLRDFPAFGSAGGGGRYDDLASQFIQKKLPGVGASIGVTRLMELVLSAKLLEANRKSPADVLVAVYSEEERNLSNATAEKLRSFGIPTEVFYKSIKLGKQIDYASEKGIQFVLFIDPSDHHIEVKDLNTKQQAKVENLESWARGLKASRSK